MADRMTAKSPLNQTLVPLGDRAKLPAKMTRPPRPERSRRAPGRGHGAPVSGASVVVSGMRDIGEPSETPPPVGVASAVGGAIGGSAFPLGAGRTLSWPAQVSVAALSGSVDAACASVDDAAVPIADLQPATSLASAPMLSALPAMPVGAVESVVTALSAADVAASGHADLDEDEPQTGSFAVRVTVPKAALRRRSRSDMFLGLLVGAPLGVLLFFGFQRIVQSSPLGRGAPSAAELRVAERAARADTSPASGPSEEDQAAKPLPAQRVLGLSPEPQAAIALPGSPSRASEGGLVVTSPVPGQPDDARSTVDSASARPEAPASEPPPASAAQPPVVSADSPSPAPRNVVTAEPPAPGAVPGLNALGGAPSDAAPRARGVQTTMVTEVEPVQGWPKQAVQNPEPSPSSQAGLATDSPF